MSTQYFPNRVAYDDYYDVQILQLTSMMSVWIALLRGFRYCSSSSPTAKQVSQATYSLHFFGLGRAGESGCYWEASKQEEL